MKQHENVCETYFVGNSVCYCDQQCDVYLSRHPEICEKKATEMFITDIAAASNKVLKLLNDSKRRLEMIR